MRSEDRLIRRATLVVLLIGGSVACSSNEKAGIVLNVDTTSGVERQAITSLQVTVNGTARSYAVTTSSSWSLGIITSAGSKLIVVDGLSGAMVIARSDQKAIEAKNGEVIPVDVILRPFSVHTGQDGGDDAPPATGGITGTDASPDGAGSVDTGGNAGTAGVVGAGGMAGSPGIDGGGAAGGLPGTGGSVGTGGMATGGGITGAGGSAGAGGGVGGGGSSSTGQSGGTGGGSVLSTGGAIDAGIVMGGGGAVGTGGSVATAGIVATGAVGGTGGAVSTGGVVGGGGTGGTGGTVTTGGIGGTGDTVTTGGTVATGGTGGTGGTVTTGGTVATGGTGGIKSGGCNLASTISACGSSSSPCTINIGGTPRTYLVQLPSAYASSNAYPVVFQFHPLGFTAESTQTMYGIRPRFPNAIYVTPQGLTSGSSPWPNTNGQDFTFVRAMLADVQAKYCVDDTRVFSVGFSHGAVMSYAVGCEMSDVFRAIAAMSGSFLSDPTCTGPAIAMWGSHGVDDNIVPLASGRAARDRILLKNHCWSSSTPVSPSPCTSYQGCDQGYPAVWCEWDGEHAIPSFGSSAIATFLGQF